MKYFESRHPIVVFIYLISVMLITMLTKSPFILGLSLLGSLLFCAVIQRPKMFFVNMLYYIPMFMLITITNPLFSQRGETILFFLNDKRVTLEAFYYGMAIAGMICSILYWSKAYVEVMESDKFLYLFGTVTPRLSLIISMAIRFIPLFKAQFKKIDNAQKAIGLYNKNGYVEKIKNKLRVFSSIITWAFENSIHTSQSMKARGYGLTRRTNYSLFKFTAADGILLSIIISLDIVIIVFYSLQMYEFFYYPSMSNIVFNLGFVIANLVVFILMIIPFLCEVKESLKWRYLKSKI